MDSMRPELAVVIREHIAENNLGDVLSGAVQCVETISVLPKKGAFGMEKIIYTAAVLAAGWLVWANSGTDVKPHAMSARLNLITVQDYSQSSFAKLIADFGVVINGLHTDVSAAGSTFIGLEENAAGKKFRDALISAVHQG